MKLLAGGASFVGGTLSALELGSDVPLAALMLLALAALLGAVLLASLRRSPWTALIALAFTLGVLRVALGDDAPAPTYASIEPQQVEGVVLSDVEALGNFARFRLELERIQREGGEWMAAEGTLLVTARANVELAEMRQAPYFRYGDRLLIEGVIEEPPDLEAFDYAAYLARQGIVEVLDARRVKLVGEGEGSLFYRSLYEIRRQLAASIAIVVPEPQAALGQATLLGLRRNIPSDLTEAFRRTGTAHLLAISGLHVGILLGISLSVSVALLGRKYYPHLIAPLVVIWLYGLLAGMSPSATRACIMGSVYLVSLAFGRQRGSLAPIGCAAAIMVAVSPSVIYSISFQLSFAAIAGIAAFTDLFGDRLRSHIDRTVGHRSMLRALLAGVTDMLAISLAATLATLPLIAFHFERVSTLGIPASVMTLPALPFLIVGGAGTALTGLASTTFAMPFGWIAWGAGKYLTGVVALLAEVPGASIDIGGIAGAAVVGYYGALVLAYGAASGRSGAMQGILRRIGNARGSAGMPQAGNRFRRGRIAMWLLVPAAFAASFAWSQAVMGDNHLGDDHLRVVFFDVGQGDAVFIETPSGRQMVVDGGERPLLMARLLGERMRFNDRSIDIVAASHPNSDHIGGLLQVLERYDVGAVLERRIEYESATYEAWARAVDEEQTQGARMIEAGAGLAIMLDSDVRLEVLGPPRELLRGTGSDADNASLVLRLTYGEVSFLLTGDVFAVGERAMLASGVNLDSDVLKVPHHGSDTSSTAEFLSAVSPAVAVISVGAENRFGHPGEGVVRRLRGFVGEDGLYMTSERGAVEFITDGETLWVQTER